MNVRQALPGEHLSPSCGHHCGVRSAAEEGSRLTFIGHCRCPECICLLADYPSHVNIEIIEDPAQPPGTARLVSGDSEATITGLAPRTPMCDSWAPGLMLDRSPVILAIDPETAQRLAEDGV